MPVLPVPDYKVVVNYTSRGITHKQSNYLDAVLNSGTGKFDTVPNVGFSTLAVSVVVDALYVYMAHVYSAAQATFDGYVLYQKAGGAYIPVETGTTAQPPLDGNNTIILYRNTIFGRGTAYSIAKPTFFEPSLDANYKSTSLPGLPTRWQNLIKGFFQPASDSDMGAWCKTFRGEAFSAWRSMVIDPGDRKTRQRRGDL